MFPIRGIQTIRNVKDIKETRRKISGSTQSHHKSSDQRKVKCFRLLGAYYMFVDFKDTSKIAMDTATLLPTLERF